MSTAITNSAPEVPAAADNVINAMDKNFIEVRIQLISQQTSQYLG